MKFIKFIIEGDLLDPIKAQQEICSKYSKIIQEGPMLIDKPYIHKIISQKTNKYAYWREDATKQTNNSFLCTVLKELLAKKIIIDKYLIGNNARLEFIIYAGNKTDLILMPETLNLLKELGVEMRLSFC